MTKGIIDRFEGDIALIETDQGMVQITKDRLPADAREGDYVQIDGEQITIDHQETASRKAELEKRLKSLFTK